MTEPHAPSRTTESTGKQEAAAVLVLIGFVLVVVGAWLVAPALALAFAGAVLFIVGWKLL